MMTARPDTDAAIEHAKDGMHPANYTDRFVEAGGAFLAGDVEGGELTAFEAASGAPVDAAAGQHIERAPTQNQDAITRATSRIPDRARA